MPVSRETPHLWPFRPLSAAPPPCDLQMLMAYPFFSLAKTPRATPIRFQAGRVTTHVAGTLAHGMATIWDADVLLWVTSQIVGARNAGLPTSRLVAARPYDILTYIGRGTSRHDYERLRGALDRLQSTSVATSLRQADAQRLHRFSWLNEWRGGFDLHGKPLGVELILPDWLYRRCLSPTRRCASIRGTSISPAALSAGCIAWCANTAAVSPPAGVSTLSTCTGSPAAVRSTLTSRATCGGLPVRGACRATRSRSVVVERVGNRWRLPRRERRSATESRTSSRRCDLWISCEQPRAIRRGNYRAIRRATIVLSGVRRGFNPLF